MTEEKKNVWIFTFEYAGIAKVGGLGEVPANQAIYLKKNFEVTVFIPSHGQIERLKDIIELEKLPFTCSEHVNLTQLEINEPEVFCEISYYQCKINNVNVILLSGENSITSRYLDDDNVYNPDTFTTKILFFSVGMRFYMKYLISNQISDVPDIIHMHDYHVVIPFIGIKQELLKNDLDTKSIITIHLLSWPKKKLDFYYACGIDETPIKILLNEGFKLLTIQEIFELCEDPQKESKEYIPPTIEKIGAVISDLVTTVSESYLQSDIIPNLGKDLIEFKSDFVWDGCDWDFNKTYKNIIDKLGNEICEVLQIPSKSLITTNHMKDYLLTYKISHLTQSPLIKSKKILKVINEISNGNTFIENGEVKSFEKSGPLAISTGRMSAQKGFETILEAISAVIKIIPEARFLLLLLPTDYSLKEIKEYAQFVKKYPNNLRIVFGLAAEIYQIAHIAADVYCGLSRWEPFGIIALEAMASKLPVITTKVGGLQESVIDIRTDPENGTGILIEKDNDIQFKDALISIFKLVEISNLENTSETIAIANSIPDKIIRKIALSDKDYYKKIKINSYRRVNEYFKWEIVTKKLIELYKKVMEFTPNSKMDINVE